MVHPNNIVRFGAGALMAAVSQATTYVLQDTYDVTNFFTEFEFFDGSDPTGGFVQYLDNATASSEGLAGYSDGAVYMGVDHTTASASNGRQSVRVSSVKSYTEALVIMDADHLPVGCGTWPAFWMFGPNWPNSGEIDIIEGVNSATTDTITLHTGPSCSMTNAGSLSSSQLSTENCNAGNGGDGCSQTTASTQGYGSGFNANSGGVYAMEWTDQSISVWFFPRGSATATALSGGGNASSTAGYNATGPDPSSFGTPVAMFTPDSSNGGCDMSSHFVSMNIVFDITLCGQWAGQQSVWSNDATCGPLADTCNDYVANNPSAFDNAYFLVNYVKVYQQGNVATRAARGAQGRSYRRWVA